MKEINITISKCPKDQMGEKMKRWCKVSYIVSYNDKIWEVAPNFTVDKMVTLIKEEENSL